MPARRYIIRRSIPAWSEHIEGRAGRTTATFGDGWLERSGAAVATGVRHDGRPDRPTAAGGAESGSYNRSVGKIDPGRVAARGAPHPNRRPARPLVRAVLVAVVTALSQAGAHAARTVRVIVTDTTGAPLVAARVVPDGATGSVAPLTTDARGEVAVPVADGQTIDATVSADGYSSAVLRLSSASGPVVRVILAPAPIATSVDVIADAVGVTVPASTTTVSSKTIDTSAAGTLDDLLRSTPGFSLFRRSSSRTANPTTQGVTLRGVSGSGASRTLVLADAIPLNDPFGSWVYWNRVPEAAIERVDVVRGPAGDVWGADALGGVVRIGVRRPTRSTIRANVEGGTQSTARGSAYGGLQRHGWSLDGAGEVNRSDGAYVVAESDRGAVDVPAYSNYSTATAGGGWSSGVWRGELSAGVYDEDRGNGTPLQSNSTSWHQVAAKAAGPALGGFWEARASGGRQSYEQSFTAVTADRSGERLTSIQLIPTDFLRGGGQWVRRLGAHDVAIGADWRRTSATVEETQYVSPALPLATTTAGGQERIAAAFARGQFAVARAWKLGVGGRFDVWRTTPGGAAQPQHSATLFSPRATLAWGGSSVSAHVSAGQAYRAPTLNELYRGFRAGNVVTAPNDRLVPERLTAIEAGAVVRRSSWSARVTLFANVLDEAIANLTVKSTPQLITRQRSNSDRLSARGVEIEGDWRVARTLTVSGQVVFTDSRFEASQANPALAGNRVPQVPRVSVGGAIVWDDPRVLTASIRARGTSMAFDDDLNTLPLAAYGVVDLHVGRQVARSLAAFVAVENLFDVEYDVARTPTRSIGWPRSLRAGVRVEVR
jgi:outer membrane receptor protein involved in Fe transport